MRPSTEDPAVRMLRRRLPEFEDRYLDLHDLYGEDLTEEVVFMELADFVTELLVTCEAPDTLNGCLSVLEDVAGSLPGGRELVCYSFFNEMSAGTRLLVRSQLSQTLDTLLDRLENGDAIEEGA